MRAGFEMTKDGFAFLVMGFTGKEAARFTVNRGQYQRGI